MHWPFIMHEWSCSGGVTSIFPPNPPPSSLLRRPIDRYQLDTGCLCDGTAPNEMPANQKKNLNQNEHRPEQLERIRFENAVMKAVESD